MTFDELPPVMRELVRLLPPTGTDWSINDRVRWLQAFEASSRLVFKDDIPLRISAERETAPSLPFLAPKDGVKDDCQ